MKKILATLFGILLSSTVANGMSAAMMAQFVTGSSGGTFSCAAQGASDLLCEQFDGTSACTGDFAAYSNCNSPGWGSSNAADVNIQASGLEPGTNYGAYVSGNGGGTIRLFHFFAQTDPSYYRFIYSPTVSMSSNQVYPFFSTQDGYNDYGINPLGIVNNSGSLAWSLTCAGNAVPVTSATPSIVQGSLYYIWASFAKGNPSACSVWISTTKTKPASPTLTTTGVQTESAGEIIFSESDVSWSDYLRGTFDRIEVWSSAFGDQP